MPSIRRANTLARALVCGLLMLLGSAGSTASAQVLPDIYPDAVPPLPQPPAVGPVPDLPPVSGQDRTPETASGCAGTGLPADVPSVDARGIDPNAPNPLRGLVPPAEARARDLADHQVRALADQLAISPPRGTANGSCGSTGPATRAGACNGGPLPVGSWWPERALMFRR